MLINYHKNQFTIKKMPYNRKQFQERNYQSKLLYQRMFIVSRLQTSGTERQGMNETTESNVSVSEAVCETS